MKTFGKTVKSLLALILILSVTLLMTACSGNDGKKDETDAPTKAAEAETDAPTEPETDAPTESPANPGEDALAFVSNLKIGWNLGNTFDASDCNWLEDEMEYESAWCGAKTTKEIIKLLKDKGFNAVRIPVSWHNHVSADGKYTISAKWLERVNEVVDYCIDEDMYVILNIHHDNSTEFMYPTSKYLDQSIDYVTTIWTQLADRFKDYDNHLIFECMNEPRMVGHNNEWWIDNSADCKDAIDCINKINQAFVDTVRKTGGNNASRYLACPGYDASPDGALNSGFVIPKDTEGNDNRIIISVHAYTPYNFALEYPGTDKWSSSDSGDLANMTGFMDRLYQKYVKKGVPVIIDEFGARDKNGNTAARTDFAASYIAAAKERGMVCFWWDNNAFEGDGELFGILNRGKCEFAYPEIVDALIKSAEG